MFVHACQVTEGGQITGKVGTMVDELCRELLARCSQVLVEVCIPTRLFGCRAPRWVHLAGVNLDIILTLVGATYVPTRGQGDVPRKRRTSGRAANSTAIVNRFRCSTFKPYKVNKL